VAVVAFSLRTLVHLVSVLSLGRRESGKECHMNKLGTLIAAICMVISVDVEGRYGQHGED
jgi:hypothetical protein